MKIYLSVCCFVSYTVAGLVVVDLNMVFDAETLAQLLEVVGATVAAAIGAHEESGGSRHEAAEGAPGNCRRRVSRW